jgi:hypothetical protein
LPLVRNVAEARAGIASLVVVRIVLDLEDERHSVLILPHQTPITRVRLTEDGVQLA